jgi:hypothetical protein
MLLDNLFWVRRRGLPAPRGFRPAVEALEDRWLPSQAILPNLPATPTLTAPTVPTSGPGAGDVNPYGVAFVPQGFASGTGPLQAGDILVSNFNNSHNLQGTGTTIVRITPSGSTSTFFHSSVQGLTTALGVLKMGFVIVGNVPTTDGTPNTIQQGSLQILDSSGHVVTTLANAAFLNGPWDATVVDNGSTAMVFVSNVFTGTVTRLDLAVSTTGVTVQSMTQIASGYAHRTDPNALVLGPTGLAYDPSTGILYVAATANNAIYGIPNAATRTTDAGKGQLVYRDPQHLHGPLGLVLAPNGDLITANGDAVNFNKHRANELVEFTPQGQFVAQKQVDTMGSGAAFGIAISTSNQQLHLAAVDDGNNTLEEWTISLA